jgi:hypothetical protein
MDNFSALEFTIATQAKRTQRTFAIGEQSNQHQTEPEQTNDQRDPQQTFEYFHISPFPK